MVRVKDRYLLVNIVYPEATTDKQTVPDFVALHQPTTDSLVHQHLVAAIKNEIRELFGDYGVGSVERSLYGKATPTLPTPTPSTVGLAHLDRQSNIYPTRHPPSSCVWDAATFVSFGPL